MPRPVGSTCIPSYRRHNATKNAVVTISGSDYYLGKWNSAESKTEYRRLIAEFLVRGQGALPDNSVRVIEVLNGFWKHAQAEYGAPGMHVGEIGAYRVVIRMVKHLYADTPVTSFGPVALKAVRQPMIEAGWCRRYINRQVGRVKHIFKWAVGNEMIPVTVYQALLTVEGLKRGKSAARESKKVKPVPDEQVNAILSRLSRHVRAMVELQWATGMRPGEMCIIRGCDIDRTGITWAYRPFTHKTEHHDIERVIFLGPKAQAVIAPFLKDDQQGYIFSPADSEAERRQKQSEERVTPLSCGNKPGTNRKPKPKKSPLDRYTPASYRRAIQYACDKVFQMPDEFRPAKDDSSEVKAQKSEQRSMWRRKNVWHPHQLRHSAATAIRKDYGLEAAQSVLGHASPNMTLIYAEANSKHAEQIMAEVG